LLVEIGAGAAEGHDMAGPLDLVFDDVLALGASLLPDAALVALLFDGGLDSQRASELATAILLDDKCRAEVLRTFDEGPRLLAALELGRRALILPTRARVRVLSPTDAAAIAGPHLPRGADRVCVLALDRTLRLARVTVVGGDEPHVVDVPAGALLAPVLAAGARHAILVHRHHVGRAAPTAADELAFAIVLDAARTLDIAVVDHVILGPDGLASRVRDGALPSVLGYR
jgi:DNA repair protein RadC